MVGRRRADWVGISLTLRRTHRTWTGGFVTSSGQVTAASALPFAVGSLVWSPDGATVFAGASAHFGDESEVGGLARLDAAMGEIRWRIDEGRVGALAVSPD